MRTSLTSTAEAAGGATEELSQGSARGLGGGICAVGAFKYEINLISFKCASSAVVQRQFFLFWQVEGAGSNPDVGRVRDGK